MALAPGVANPQEYVGDTVAREQTSLWADAWRRLRRNRLALVATVFIGFVLLVAIISVFWTPYPIYRESVAPTYEGLSSQHLLGADQAGRDILSRLAVGAQISLEVGVGTQILVVAFGILVGLTAGYYRGILDGVISTVIVMATVLLSTIYPAFQASRMSQPDIERRWRMSEPAGDIWRFQFPFTVSGLQPSSAATRSWVGLSGWAQRGIRRARKARAWGVEWALARRRRSMTS